MMSVFLAATVIAPAVYSQEEMTFPGYEPKTTPDSILDYRSQLAGELSKIPDPSLKTLPALINMLAEYQKRAEQNPGKWTHGHVGLGADPDQYVPSDEELMVSEIGKKIHVAIAFCSREELAAALTEAGISLKSIEFGLIRFRHVDVMGSGRFFYASNPVKTVISFK